MQPAARWPRCSSRGLSGAGSGDPLPDRRPPLGPRLRGLELPASASSALLAGRGGRRAARRAAGRPRPRRAAARSPGWPVALKTGVNGVNRPERVNVDIGSGAAVSSVPSGSGRSASAGRQQRVVGRQERTSRRAKRLQPHHRGRGCSSAPSLRIIEKIAQLIGSMSSRRRLAAGDLAGVGDRERDLARRRRAPNSSQSPSACHGGSTSITSCPSERSSSAASSAAARADRVDDRVGDRRRAWSSGDPQRARARGRRARANGSAGGGAQVASPGS